jgi:hypothetical protein
MKSSDTEAQYKRMEEIIESIKVDGWLYAGNNEYGIIFVNPSEPGITLTLSLSKHKYQVQKEPTK